MYATFKRLQIKFDRWRLACYRKLATRYMYKQRELSDELYHRAYPSSTGFTRAGVSRKHFPTGDQER